MKIFSLILFTLFVLFFVGDPQFELEQMQGYTNETIVANIPDNTNLLSLIAQAESSERKFPIGDNGKSKGAYHMSKPIVKEYNRKHNTNYSHSDLLNPAIDDMIAKWWLEEITNILEGKNLYSTAKVVHFWNRGARAIKEPLPKGHKNKIYDTIYKNHKNRKGE